MIHNLLSDKCFPSFIQCSIQHNEYSLLSSITFHLANYEDDKCPKNVSICVIV